MAESCCIFVGGFAGGFRTLVVYTRSFKYICIYIVYDIFCVRVHERFSTLIVYTRSFRYILRIRYRYAPHPYQGREDPVVAVAPLVREEVKEDDGAQGVPHHRDLAAVVCGAVVRMDVGIFFMEWWCAWGVLCVAVSLG